MRSDLSVCARYVVNSEDVKDVLQESFLKIMSGIASFSYRGKGSLRGWLTKVTVNEALKHLQRDNRIAFVGISVPDHDQADTEPDVDSIPSADLFRMIRELPDGYRTGNIIILYPPIYNHPDQYERRLAA